MNVLIEESTMTAIADSIRGKTGNTDLILPADMPTEIDTLDKVYFTNSGVGYLVNMELDITGQPIQWNLYSGAWRMKTVSMPNCVATTAVGNTFNGCTGLTTAFLPKFQNLGSNVFNNCTLLKSCQLGSVGYPVTGMHAQTFNNCKQTDLEITVYVDAETLADTPTEVSSTAPWGATNATIIYCNSTTGEVITE